jgi:hypothetical protein
LGWVDDLGHLKGRARLLQESTAQLEAQARERAVERRSIRRVRSLAALGVAAALVATTLTVIAMDL